MVDIQHVHLSPVVNLIRKSVGRLRLSITLNGTEEGLARASDSASLLTPLTRSLERQAIHLSDRVIAVSNTLKREVVSYYSVNATRVNVIQNGIDLNEFDSTPAHQEFEIGLAADTLMLYVGGSSPRKGLGTLLRALHKVKSQRFGLVVTGPGTTSSYRGFSELIRELQLENRIVILPPLSREKLLSLYQRCDVFVHPSLYEGLSLALLEAMASRLPIVASAIGSSVEALGSNGLLFPPGNERVLATCIELLLSDSTLRREYGNRVYQSVARYDWKRLAKEYSNLMAAAV